MQSKFTPRHTHTCEHCGEAFTPKNPQNSNRYCSLDCYNESRRALSATARAALMANATARIRGAKRSHDDLCRRAQGKQRNAKLSGDEAEIMQAFDQAGLSPVPLYAVDKFNIDFAFPSEMVAVEYHGGNWYNTPAKQAQDRRKAEYLRSHGWTLLVFPRIEKPQANNAGNRRIEVAEIVRQTTDALQHG